MADFNIAIVKLLENEGGYANRINDKGKETYKGISRRFWPDWEGWKIIDEYKKKPNFPINLEADQKLQTLVVDFYRVNFWKEVSGDNVINQNIAFSIFDYAVNAGPDVSVMAAQKAAGCLSDGIIGVNTLSKWNSIDAELFLAKFALEKIARYIKIVRKDKTQEDNFFGWICRTVKE